MTCTKCNNEQKPESNFCGNCGNQLKCLSCSEKLISDANFCGNCGTNIKEKQVASININTFELNETRESRSIKAEFSDDMGSNFTQTLAQFAVKKFDNKQLSNGVTNDLNNDEQDDETIDVKHQEVKSRNTINNQNQFEETTNKIFKFENQVLKLIDTRIKASGKGDYFKRLTYLSLLFFEENNLGVMEKSILNDLMRRAGLYDGNFRNWFSDCGDFDKNNDGIALIIPGREKAKEYLKDVFNESAEDKWKPGATKQAKTTKTKPKIKAEKSKSKTKTSTQTLSFVDDLNLRPKNENSLLEFYNNLTVKTNYERNLVFVYYLQQVLKVNGVTVNHIYTCYKNVSQRVPKSLYQSLTDTKTDKGWIKTQDRNNITVTPTGENVVEYDLKKND